MTHSSVIDQILDAARWAPSGDNTQNWRFETISDSHVVVHGFDTRDHCVYDLDGHPSQISLGALIETAAIAASAHGLEMTSALRAGSAESRPTLDLRFFPGAAGVRPNPLQPAIRHRSVQRRAMSTRPLTREQKTALHTSLGSGYDVMWIEDFSGRWKTAALMFTSANLRLTMPEAYRVHCDIIEWGARYSVDRVPDQALGVDPLTLRLMRFVLGSWNRVKFFNTFLAGTLMPRIQMDLIPGMGCAAHFVLIASKPPTTIENYIEAGRRVQRFWLTATHLGLQLQPELTPLIFARYFRQGTAFSELAGATGRAGRVAQRLQALLGEHATANVVFMGRVGSGPTALSRSLRKELDALRMQPESRTDGSGRDAERQPVAPERPRVLSET